MGRTMPFECEHGTTIDWGDFGPCQDCADHGDDDCPNFQECEQCTEARADFPRVIEVGPFGLVVESAATRRRYFVSFNKLGGEEEIGVTEVATADA